MSEYSLKFMLVNIPGGLALALAAILGVEINITHKLRTVKSKIYIYFFYNKNSKLL